MGEEKLLGISRSISPESDGDVCATSVRRTGESGLKRGEKSDDPLSFKSNHVNEDVSFYRSDESMKDSCLFVFLV